MTNVRNNFDIRFWEYMWYFFVTVFLLSVGALLIALALLRKVVEAFRRPLLSFRNILLFALAGGLAMVGLVYLEYTATNDLGARQVEVVVQPGDRFAKVAHQLAEQGVVNSELLLRYPARLLRVDTRLIPGTYVFTGENSARSVLDKLSRGDVLQVRLTVPEGIPIWRTASILAADLELDSASLVQLNTDKPFLDSLNIPHLEGYLFPETYKFAPGVDLRTVVREMVRMFHEKTDTIWQVPTTTGLSKAETVILASIVEAETPLTEEKPVVASVYANRLKLGMSLDADPTIIYGMGGLDRPLLRVDLDTVTQYNTYRTAGLPPTPINSPGLSALSAAAHPANTGYLFFVANGTGSGAHIFSYTNEQHNTARKQARITERRLQRDLD